jgi:hypothetical protein
VLHSLAKHVLTYKLEVFCGGIHLQVPPPMKMFLHLTTGISNSWHASRSLETLRRIALVSLELLSAFLTRVYKRLTRAL